MDNLILTQRQVVALQSELTFKLTPHASTSGLRSRSHARLANWNN